MRATHSKNYTLDNSNLQKLLRGDTFYQDNTASSPLTPIKDRLNPSITSLSNGSIIKYKENDISLNRDISKKLILTPEHLRYSPEQTLTNIEYHGNQDYANMMTNINSLNLELNKMRIKEQKYMGRILTLEKDKQSLMNLLTQSETKLQDSIIKSKEENKRVNLIIESFRNSLATMNNSIQDGLKNKVCKQTQTNESLNLEDEKNSLIVGHISMLKNKLDTLESYCKDVINENIKIKEELTRKSSTFDNLRSELNEFKISKKNEQNLKGKFETHYKQILVENTYFKQYIKSMSDFKENNNIATASSFENYKASVKNQNIKKNFTNNIFPVPAYLKIISFGSEIDT